MKNKLLQYILLPVSGLVAILVIAVLYFSRHSYDTDCSFKKFPDFYLNRNELNLADLVKSFPADSLQSHFPYNDYLNSGNWKSPISVRRDLARMDSVNHDPYSNMNVLSIALTKELTFWNSDNLDSLNLLLLWAEKFNTKAVFSDEHDLLYGAVYNYWISMVSERLDKLNQADYSIQFDCKFRFLRMKCCQLQGDCGDRDNLLTKAIKNMIDGDWAYLLNRFWIGTSIIFKIIALLIFVLTLYGYICIIQKHLKK